MSWRIDFDLVTSMVWLTAYIQKPSGTRGSEIGEICYEPLLSKSIVGRMTRPAASHCFGIRLKLLVFRKGWPVWQPYLLIATHWLRLCCAGRLCLRNWPVVNTRVSIRGIIFIYLFTPSRPSELHRQSTRREYCSCLNRDLIVSLAIGT